MPTQNSNQTQNTIEVIMKEEEANKYLNSFKDKMGYKDISLIIKPIDTEDNEESKEEIKRLKTIRNKLIDGIRIGIIFFDEENKVGEMSACRTSRACRPTTVCRRAEGEGARKTRWAGCKLACNHELAVPPQFATAKRRKSKV